MPSFHDALLPVVQVLIGVPLTLVALSGALEVSKVIVALWDGKRSFRRWPRKTLSKWTSIWMRFLFPFIAGLVGGFLQILTERHKDREFESNHPILLWLLIWIGTLIFTSHLLAMARRTEFQCWNLLRFSLLWFGMGLLGVIVAGSSTAIFSN